ncbi:MFS transporter, partial [Palleronia rufa]|uniref:MFS transporter n=1 Tax=Palleronia rufa TaxID=1530186 RepID=UPI0039F0D845
MAALTDIARAPAPSEAGPTRLTLFALLASATLTVMAGATISPSLPGLVAHFADDPRAEWLVPFILTAPGLAIAVAAPLSGVLVDRTVKRRVLLAGIVLYVLAGSSGLYLDSLDAILVGRLFLGLAVGAVMTASMALIADVWEGEARQRVLGWQAASMGVGGILFI